MNLYCTADSIGIQTGGGAVTFHESEAMKELGPCRVLGRSELLEAPSSYRLQGEPWLWDSSAEYFACNHFLNKDLRLCHFYAGTFYLMVEEAKQAGCKVTYTAAAHSIEKSRKAHEELGIPYVYPHLTDPVLWERYVRGYLQADVLICPSKHSAEVMRSFGATNRIEIIPHGVHLPDKIHPLPERFTVGYLGAVGPDKGLRYLLEAWKKLNYKDAYLMLGGRDSDSPYVQSLVSHFAPNTNIALCGWVPDVANFYAACSVYVQPSVTEGFGIEVLEAMAHGRLVICSDGAGAADVIPDYMRGFVVPAGRADALAVAIDTVRRGEALVCTSAMTAMPRRAAQFTWDKIRERYKALWKELLT